MTPASDKAAYARLLKGLPMKEKDLWAALGYAGKFSWGETRKGHFVVRREGTQFPASLAVGHDGEVKRCYVRNLCRHFGLEEE